MNSTTSDVLNWQVMQDYVPDALMKRYTELFNFYDSRGSGVIKVRDVVDILGELGKCVCDKDVQAVLEIFLGEAPNDSTFIDFHEFLIISSALVSICVPEDEMSAIYGVFDQNNDGYITPQELTELFSSLSEEISEIEIQEMIREADQDGDGKVTYDDFLRMITNSSPNDQSECINNKLLEEIESSNINRLNSLRTPTEETEQTDTIIPAYTPIKSTPRELMKKTIRATKRVVRKLFH